MRADFPIENVTVQPSASLSRLMHTKCSKVAFWRLHNSQNRIQSDFTRGIMQG